jgi:hypothetical protein
MRKAGRIAFVHTVSFVADECRKLMRAELPDVDCFHVLNEGLLQDLLRGGDRHRAPAREAPGAEDRRPDGRRSRA